MSQPLPTFASALLTSLLFRRHYAGSEPFILELPLCCFPSGGQTLPRGWQKPAIFLKRASEFTIAGVVEVLAWLVSFVFCGTA